MSLLCKIVISHHLVSQRSATPRRIQWSGSKLAEVLSNRGKMYVRSVRRGFLYTGHSYRLDPLRRSAFIAYTWTIGSGVYRTFGDGSIRRELRRSHPAPSKYRP